MDVEELPLAFARHATSKITGIDDLYSLGSYGFRGEALASAASVARVSCISFPAEDDSVYSGQERIGGQIVIEGGETKSIGPLPPVSNLEKQKHGTEIYIRDLFFNTPARLKFIRGKIAEKRALKQMVSSFILAWPGIKFSVRWDEKDRSVFPSQSDRQSRIEQLFSRNSHLKNNSMRIIGPFSQEYAGIKVEGYIYNSPTGSGNFTTGLVANYLWVNGRLVLDKGLHQRIVWAMDKFFAITKNNPCGRGDFSRYTAEHPQRENGSNYYYLFFIEVLPEELDVNVHPNKIAVKFLHPATVYSVISAAFNNFKNRNPQIESANTHQRCSSEKEGEYEANDDFKVDLSRDLNVDINKDINKSTNRDINEELGLELGPTEKSPSKQVWQVNGDFIISTFVESAIYIMHVERLLRYYFCFQIVKHTKMREEQIVPLLVSIPFRVTMGANRQLDSYLPFLAQRGFIFDRLNAETLVLRSIPEYLNNIDYRAILQGWIAFFESRKSINNNINIINPLSSSSSIHDSNMIETLEDSWQLYSKYYPYPSQSVPAIGTSSPLSSLPPITISSTIVEKLVHTCGEAELLSAKVMLKIMAQDFR